MLQPLQEKANPESQNYSNANLATIFGSYGGGWSPTKPRVNISGGCTMVDVEMKNERRGQIEIQSFLDTDFGAACNHLVEQLSRFSPSVEEIFPQKSTSLGSITLETDANAPVPMILWVYHNVFVWAELRMLELDEPMSLEDLASTRTSFKSLTDQLFENIRDGCVAARDEVIRPKVQHKSTPDIVHVGEVFAVQVSVDQQVFHDVQCDSSKLVFGDFDIQESDRKYTFLATETGEAFIRLNFAHPDTFNSTSVDLKVNIEPRQNK
ncbi:hypothetical protein F5B18DRAFT_262671 [Nemania serpens]|nr:hypothetical protein F5B18DRAFT_262671 [Nemania serpens]